MELLHSSAIPYRFSEILMRTLIVGLVVMTSPAAFAFAGDDQELKKLNGTWLIVSGEMFGKKMPAEVFAGFELVLKDGSYTLNAKGKADIGTCKVDAKKKPKELDITGTEGPNKGKTMLCIYELKDDMLTVCYDMAGKQRPTEFKTPEGKDNKVFLATYKRK